MEKIIDWKIYGILQKNKKRTAKVIVIPNRQNTTWERHLHRKGLYRVFDIKNGVFDWIHYSYFVEKI